MIEGPRPKSSQPSELQPSEDADVVNMEATEEMPPCVWGVWCALQGPTQLGGCGSFLGLLGQVTTVRGPETTDTCSRRVLERRSQK